MNFSYREAVAMWQHVLQIDPNNTYAPKYIAKAQPRIDPSAPAFDPTAAQPVQAGGASAPVATVSTPQPSHEVSADDEAAAKDAYRKAVQNMSAQQYDAAITLLDSALGRTRPTRTPIYRSGRRVLACTDTRRPSPTTRRR